VTRYAIAWDELRAVEPVAEEISSHAPALSIAYNEPANAALMGHAQPISAAEVVETYAGMLARGGRPFLLFRDDELAGDADLRGIADRRAEFAFMIGAPAAQGKGLGTRFAIMVHAFGFAHLGLDHIYASVVPHNTASRRAFEKLGYVVDASPGARAYADAPDDVTLRVDCDIFQRGHASALAQIRFAIR
jgi:RimJ/RimL family protein N-acetyltransferase